MRTFTFLLTLATVASAQPGPTPPQLIELNQGSSKPSAKLDLTKHAVGPTIPGLKSGALKYKTKGHAPLDNIIFLAPPGGK